jgi:hypothetical protein
MWDWAAQQGTSRFFFRQFCKWLGLGKYSAGSGWGGPEARFNDHGPGPLMR